MGDRPVIYHYVDYRLFLKDILNFKRSQTSQTIGEISKSAGFKSAGYLNLLIQGKRNLGLQAASKLASALRLRRQEHTFFAALVAFTQARDFESKLKAFRSLKSFRHFREAQEDLAHQYRYFSRWYFAAILAALQNEDWAQKTINQQAADLKIQVSELERAIKSLETLGLVERKRDQWRPTQASYRSANELQSLFVANFHNEMIERAIEAHNTLPSSERKMGSLTMALSSEQFEEASKRLYQFLDDLHAILDQPEATPEKVYQLNFQLFPLMDLRLKPLQKQQSVDESSAK